MRGSRATFVPGPYGNAYEAYNASKVKAFNATEAWIEREKPPFDVVHIHSGFVVGRDELAREVKDILNTSNNEALTAILGGDAGYVATSSIHINDISLAHVKALDPRIPGNQGYFLHSEGREGPQWEKSFDIVAKNFSAAVEDGRIANNGKVSSLSVKVDASKSKEILNMEFLSLEEQLKSVLERYLELLDRTA